MKTVYDWHKETTEQQSAALPHFNKNTERLRLWQGSFDIIDKEVLGFTMQFKPKI